MALILWILAAISLTASALPTNVEFWNKDNYNADTRNTALEEAILSLLESLRQDMVSGSESIPVLDPLYLEQFHLDGETFNLTGSHITLEETFVRNLSTFSVESLSVTMTNLLLQRYRIILDMRIPSLHVESNKYAIYLHVMGYSIFGNGGLELTVLDPRIKANVLVGMRISSSGIYLTIIESEIIFDLVAFEPKITGLFNNEYGSDFVNRFLSYLIPDLVTEYQSDITKVLSNLAMEVGNEILKDLNLIDIIG